MYQKYIEYIYMGDKNTYRYEKLNDVFNPLKIVTDADGFRLIEKNILGMKKSEGKWYLFGKRISIELLLIKYGIKPEAKVYVDELFKKNVKYLCRTSKGNVFPMVNDDITIDEYRNSILRKGKNILERYIIDNKINDRFIIDNYQDNCICLNTIDDKYEVCKFLNNKKTDINYSNNLKEGIDLVIHKLCIDEFNNDFWDLVQKSNNEIDNYFINIEEGKKYERKL